MIGKSTKILIRHTPMIQVKKSILFLMTAGANFEVLQILVLWLHKTPVAFLETSAF